MVTTQEVRRRAFVHCVRSAIDQHMIATGCGGFKDADQLAEQITAQLEREGRMTF